jgi:hypothetical protein
MAYLYNYIGKPWKTQRLVRQIVDSLYNPGPEGLPGNEDCGQMSAWYIWSALGFYPVTPGSPYYAIGTPLFDTATIAVRGHNLNVVANRTSKSSIYVNAVLIDGKPLATNLISHDELVRARQIQFTLGDTPDLQRGTAVELRSSLPAAAFVRAPIIISSQRLFTDSAVIVIEGQNIRYSMNGDSTTLPLRYTGPINVTSTSRIHARSYSTTDSSGVTSASFYRIPADWHVQLNSIPNKQYAADGPISLIDGIRGSIVWRKGDWHGFQGQDMDVEIHMDSARSISSVHVGFLQDVRPWIVFPRSVTVQTSNDGSTWNDVGTVVQTIPVTDMSAQTTTIVVPCTPTTARFVRIKAANYGKLPSWHPGAGSDAFIFCDEIEAR